MKVMSFENDIAKRWGTETYIVVGEQDKMRETKTWLAEIKFKAVKLIIPMGGARRVRFDDPDNPECNCEGEGTNCKIDAAC